jgi:hypothetical protein
MISIALCCIRYIADRCLSKLVLTCCDDSRLPFRGISVPSVELFALAVLDMTQTFA